MTDLNRAAHDYGVGRTIKSHTDLAAAFEAGAQWQAAHGMKGGEGDVRSPEGQPRARARDAGPYRVHVADGGRVYVGTDSPLGFEFACEIPPSQTPIMLASADVVAAALNLWHEREAGTAGGGASLEDVIFAGGDPAEFAATLDDRGTLHVRFNSARSWHFPLAPLLREAGWFHRPTGPVKRAEEAFANAVCGYGTERRFVAKVLEALAAAGLYIATAEELDPPVCRLQLPGGSVPMNAADAAQGWHNAYVAMRDRLADEQAGWRNWAPGREPGTVRACIAAVKNMADADRWPARNAEVVRVLTNLLPGEPSGPKGGSRVSGLPETGSGGLEARERSDSYGFGCDEFPGLRGGDHAAWQERANSVRLTFRDAGEETREAAPIIHFGVTSREHAERLRRTYDPRADWRRGDDGRYAWAGGTVSVEAVFVDDRQVYPVHPVDALREVSEAMGYTLDPAKLQALRELCDEPVPADEVEVPRNERRCRICGCTANDACDVLVEPFGSRACAWAAADLCDNPFCLAEAKLANWARRKEAREVLGVVVPGRQRPQVDFAGLDAPLAQGPFTAGAAIDGEEDVPTCGAVFDGTGEPFAKVHPDSIVGGTVADAVREAQRIADALNAVDGMTCEHCHDLGNSHEPGCPEAAVSPFAEPVPSLMVAVEGGPVRLSTLVGMVAAQVHRTLERNRRPA